MEVRNRNLHSAFRNKNDEFYTRIEDIEIELNDYAHHFKGKVVYCNCDNTNSSNFCKYFVNNFKKLGLKKLICSCYNSISYGVLFEYYGEDNPNNGRKPLNGDGDFRSSECTDLLRTADIVVTKPPFSLFREYVNQLMSSGKKFLIIGNMNAITYKNVFVHIMNNEIWLGNHNVKEFITPETEITKPNTQYILNDTVMQKFGNICWFTNLDNGKENKPIELVKTYNQKDYPKYENYDAIEVSKTCNIPKDYNGIMGVPISFMHRYCPSQFKILGMPENLDLYGLKTRWYTREECQDAYLKKFGKEGNTDLNAKGVLIRNGRREIVYERILIQRI